MKVELRCENHKKPEKFYFTTYDKEELLRAFGNFSHCPLCGEKLTHKKKTLKVLDCESNDNSIEILYH